VSSLPSHNYPPYLQWVSHKYLGNKPYVNYYHHQKAKNAWLPNINPSREKNKYKNFTEFSYLNKILKLPSIHTTKIINTTVYSSLQLPPDHRSLPSEWNTCEFLLLYTPYQVLTLLLLLWNDFKWIV